MRVSSNELFSTLKGQRSVAAITGWRLAQTPKEAFSEVRVHAPTQMHLEVDRPPPADSPPGDFLITMVMENTPFSPPSCQAIEEKMKISPTANSLRRCRQRSRTCATARRALAKQRKWRPKVHQARRDDRFSSRFLLLTAAIVPTRPTHLLLCSPLPLSLRPGLMHSKM